ATAASPRMHACHFSCCGVSAGAGAVSAGGAGGAVSCAYAIAPLSAKTMVIRNATRIAVSHTRSKRRRDGASVQANFLLPSRQSCARCFQIGGAIHAFGKILHNIGADGHAHLQRTQLLKLFALLKR